MLTIKSVGIFEATGMTVLYIISPVRVSFSTRSLNNRMFVLLTSSEIKTLLTSL